MAAAKDLNEVFIKLIWKTQNFVLNLCFNKNYKL